MTNYKKTNLLDWNSGKVEGFQGKDLINLDNGGLKMVKVGSFAKYPKHLHPDKTEYIYVLEGTPKITIGENKYTGEKGDFFIFPKSVIHDINNPTEKECLLLVGAISN